MKAKSESELYPSWVLYLSAYLLTVLIELTILVLRGIVPLTYLFITTAVIIPIVLFIERKQRKLFAEWISD